MQTFTTIKSVAAVLPESNLDTDIIYPARFLLITEKKGLGQYAFFDLRHSPEGEQRADFPLNQQHLEHTQILIAGDNFGCGSSREQAAWALHDLGIRCIVSTRFGEIFQANCYKNGILPVTLGLLEFQRLVLVAHRGGVITVDLETQLITSDNAREVAFSLPVWRRESLLNGWDEIDLILEKEQNKISAFEKKQQLTMPWLYAHLI